MKYWFIYVRAIPGQLPPPEYNGPVTVLLTEIIIKHYIIFTA